MAWPGLHGQQGQFVRTRARLLSEKRPLYPVVTALIVGTMISEDRLNGTSALYFSRPITRLDYVAMKYLAAATVLFILCVFSLFVYYTVEVLAMGRGWAWIVDTFPILLGATAAGMLLVVTYTSLGLAMSSVSTNGFFPAIGLLALVLGSKSVAFLVALIFEQDVLYLSRRTMPWPTSVKPWWEPNPTTTSRGRGRWFPSWR